MNNNPTRTTIIFVTTLLLLSFGINFIENHTISLNYNMSFISFLSLITFSGLWVYYILSKNQKKIIDLKETNVEFFEAKERYDIVTKATSDTVWDLNLTEGTLIWNKGIFGVFGYSKEDVRTSLEWWFEKIHPEDSLKMSARSVINQNYDLDRWQDEYRFRCADGSYKHVKDRVFIVRNADGKAIRMIGAIQDITREKEEEQRLKLLETVIINTKVAIVITSLETNDNLLPRITFVNPAFTEITGYAPEEVQNKDFGILFNKNSDFNQIEQLRNSIKEYIYCTIETICVKKNGEEFWISLSMIPVNDSEGKHSHWISLQRDITIEKEKIKEREHLINELTKNNKDLKQFSYITSHNLRAPLSNLTGLLNLIEEIPIENEELQELIDGFANSTYQLNETINDLVKIIVIKDNPNSAKERVLINDVFESVFNQLGFLISTHKPILKLDIDDVYINNSNKSYLESIFLNLMTNSIKYRSENRQIKINVTATIENNKVLIIFSDNGIGIDLDRNKNKIFGLYQRFHDHPDSKGLGLYLVKSQVEAMGGTIDVTSEIDKGTTFIIKFNT